MATLPRATTDESSAVSASGGRDLLLAMEFRRGQLRRNLRTALRAAIQEGRLASGTRLPSSRRLAADLSVSRGVVTDVYDQLTAEGYLATVSRQAPVVAGAAGRPTVADEAARRVWRHDFVATAPDVELFPRRTWLRATERAMRHATNDALDYGDHRGRIELRTALAEYLGRVRGLCVAPAHIVVTQGFTQALDLVCRVLAARGATSMAFETPSLADEWATVRASGLRIEPVPVDGDGLRTDRLAALTAPAILVTPAHQFPTGAVMAPARRTALIGWAAAGDRLIVEDDYDAEFRYDRRAVGALQGLDPGRVIHIGTASKTLAPGMRLGWMSLPAFLVDEVRALKAASDSGSPAIDQLVLAEIIASGDYDRHVARSRHIYRRRRDALIAALRRTFPGPRIEGAAAGLHLVLRLPDHVDDRAIASGAADAGIRVRALSDLSLTSAADRGLLLGYGRMGEERVHAAVRALASVLRAHGAGIGTEVVRGGRPGQRG